MLEPVQRPSNAPPGFRKRSLTSGRKLWLFSGSLSAVLCLRLAAAPLPHQGPAPQFPPPAPPVTYRAEQPAPLGFQPLGSQSLTLYSIGQPTDEEQLYLEYLNRSRTNPPAEGIRLANTTDPDVLSAYASFSVDTNMLVSEFNTIPAVAPLALNAQMIAAARWHSGDMFTNQYQGHNQTNGAVVMDPGARLSTNGYNWYSWAENVYSYAKTVFYGHAGFNVDWGPGPGGMQNPPGHRNNIHNAAFREVGVGVFDGVNGSVGPQLVTQDFGTRQSATPLLSGVVYYDLNGNGFYDIGEGIGGVTVMVPGSTYYAVTADSGGYTVPLSSNGICTVNFSASNLSTQRVVTVSSLANVKVDYIPIYAPPVVSGPNPASLNQTNAYAFTPVGAASAHQWLCSETSPYNYVEGAENGLTNITVVSSPGYSVISSDRKSSGTYSLHLAHTNPPVDQIITWNPVLRPSTNSQLTFSKFLGFAFSNQTARAQISTDGGTTWQTMWSQSGNNGSSSVDSAFVRITNSLTAYAGQLVNFRFIFSFSSGSYFYPSPTVGVFLDDVAFSNTSQLLRQTTNNVAAGTSFGFCPTNSNNYLLAVRAQINSRTLPWGPPSVLTVTSPPPAIQLVAKPIISSGQIQLDFTVSNYQPTLTFQLWKTTNFTGTWTLDGTASLSTLVTNSKFRFTTSTSAAPRTFYRVKGSY